MVSLDPFVRRASLAKIGAAIAWAEKNEFAFIVIGTPGHDMIGMKPARDLANFMLTQSHL